MALAFAQAVRMRTMLAGPLAVVTHGLVIRVLLGTQLLLRAGDHPATHLGNTSVTVVSATAPHAVELLDCTLHLAAGATDNADALSGG